MTDPQRAIFITGAASGIGRATAELFHERGWLVGAYDLDQEALTALARHLGERCITGALDVTDKLAFDAAMSAFTTHSGGRLDLMFNNAGIAIGGYLDELPFEKVLAQVNVNFIGVLNGLHAALPWLQQTDNALCFSTASSAATFGTPGMATYAATKYAIKGLTEAMSVELARYGARAADVSPGIIATPLWQSAHYVRGEERRARDLAERNVDRTDASRTLGPDTVATCVWEAYHGDKLHYYVPPELVERDRAKALTPEALRDDLIANLPGRS